MCFLRLLLLLVPLAATASFSCASGTLSGASCLNALTRTRYEPYGNTAAGTVPNRIGFTGHVNDPDTGLVYMQQRYYDPIAGRFLSIDPVTTDANTGLGFNVYEYANNNPYRYTDPDGRDPKCSAGMAGCTVTVVSGTPQSTGTPNHDAASQKIGQAFASQGAVKVHYNQALSAVTGDPSMGLQKPDVSAVWKDGKTGGSVPFGVGLGYLAGQISREQVVNSANGGMQ